MKLKSAAQRSAIILIILFLSVLIGYVYHVVGHQMDIKNHQREYSELVEKYCKEYGVPEYIVYSLILNGSNFQSNCVSEDGRVGLMQLSPELLHTVQSLIKEDTDAGILYDPETNIRYGTYLLSYWLTEYSRWDTVLAMYLSSEETVLEWRKNPEYTDDKGNLTMIPDRNIKSAFDQVWEDAEMYRDLFYEN